jgi:hypothetical protein
MDYTAREYISTIIASLVREDLASRWSAWQVIEQIDRALAKLAEHSVLADSGVEVLVDGFGSENVVYEQSWRAATGRPRGNPPADRDVAEALFVCDVAAVDRVELGVKLVQGSGHVVRLVRDSDFAPSGKPRSSIERNAVTV